MSESTELSAIQASRQIAKGELCPVEYVEALLARINAIDHSIHAFIRVDAERALAEARERKAAWRPSGLPPLFGVPFVVKDIVDVEGTPTTCQSRVRPQRSANRNARCVDNLIVAGGVYLGKSALYEFALGGPSFDEPWAPVRNPWNKNYTPGSSSSGSGAALAARMAPLAIGTDTGGSIRSPAAMNGVVGLKPSWGRISMDGVFPLAPSMDTVGPMARTVGDTALAFECLLSPKPDAPVRSLSRAPRLGAIDHWWREELDPSTDMATALDAFLENLRGAGAEVWVRRAPPLQTFNAVGWTTLYSEAFDVHKSGLLETPERYGSPTRDMLLTGAFFSAQDFLGAQRLRKILSRRVDDALAGVDCLLTAVSALPPCRLDDRDAMTRLAAASVRVVCNVTGHPSLAIPVGFSSDDLPIGIQLIGRKNAERKLLSVAGWIEERLGNPLSGRLPPYVARP